MTCSPTACPSPRRSSASATEFRVPVRAVDGGTRPDDLPARLSRPAPGQDRCVVSLRGAGAGRLHSAALRPLAVGHAPHPRRGGGPPRRPRRLSRRRPRPRRCVAGVSVSGLLRRARGGHRCLEGPACGAEHAGPAAGAARGLTIGAARGWPRNESAHGLQPCRLRGRERRRARGLRGEPRLSSQRRGFGLPKPESTDRSLTGRDAGLPEESRRPGSTVSRPCRLLVVRNRVRPCAYLSGVVRWLARGRGPASTSAPGCTSGLRTSIVAESGSTSPGTRVGSCACCYG